LRGHGGGGGRGFGWGHRVVACWAERAGWEAAEHELWVCRTGARHEIAQLCESHATLWHLATGAMYRVRTRASSVETLTRDGMTDTLRAFPIDGRMLRLRWVWKDVRRETGGGAAAGTG